MLAMALPVMVTITAGAVASIVSPAAVSWRCPPIVAGRLTSPLCMTQPYANGHTAPSVGNDDILTTITPVVDAPPPSEQITLDAGVLDSTAPAAEPEAETLEDPSRPPISMFDVDAATVALLAKQDITHFTPVKAQSFDLLRSGRDMLARSRTGTGKTLAFSLPLIQRLAAESEGERRERGRPPRMLVLAPTRELAKQVGEVIERLAAPHGLFVTTFTGGTPYPPQQRALRGGIDVLIGTPGRLIDHLEGGELDLSNLQAVVLDEADEMLNMGFKDDVRHHTPLAAKAYLT